MGSRAVKQSPDCVAEVREAEADNYGFVDWNRGQSSNDESECQEAARDKPPQRFRPGAVLEILDDAGVGAE